MHDLSHYATLSGVFSYPGSGTGKILPALEDIVRQRVPHMSGQLRKFTEHVQRKPVSALQEYYIGTFDVQALCFLDIGYVLYGEDYKRGIFLVHMKKEQQKAGNDCGSELPDHLPNMLRLLPLLEDPLLAEELIWSVMMPALEKMIESFNDAGNAYRGMLELLLAVMEHDYPESTFERFNFSIQEKTKCFECIPGWKQMK